MLPSLQADSDRPMAIARSFTSTPSSAQPSSRTVLQKDPHQLAQLLLQLAELQVRPHSLWLSDALLLLQNHIHTLSPAETSGCLWALAIWHAPPNSTWLSAFQSRVIHLVDSKALTPRQLADILWSCAQMDISKQEPLLSTVLSAAAQQFPETPPDCLADVIWSVAKLKLQPGPGWLQQFAEASRQQLQGFSPHHLAQCVWGLARLPWNPGAQWQEEFVKASLKQ